MNGDHEDCIRQALADAMLEKGEVSVRRRAGLGLRLPLEYWSLNTLREKLIKIGVKVVRHGRYITFQMAEVAIPRTLFVNILRLIDGLPIRRPVQRVVMPHR